MNEKVKQPYQDIREQLKDNNFNSVVMKAFELICGELVEMDLQFDNYPMAHTKYLETEASEKSIEFSKKYHGTSVVVKLALEQREELLKWKESQQDLIKGKDEHIAKLLEENKIWKTIIHDKEQLIVNVSKELTELREFAKIMSNIKIVDSNPKIYGITENDIELVKNVVEKYGK